MRRGWDSLSSGYRSRLEKSGISKSDYESGANLSRGRGHSHTPEHPHAGKSRPEFAAYHNRRQEAERKVVSMKRDRFGDRPRWSETGAEKSTARMTIASLEHMASYDSLADYEDDMMYEEEEPDDEASRYHE